MVDVNYCLRCRYYIKGTAVFALKGTRKLISDVEKYLTGAKLKILREWQMYGVL